MSGVSGPAGARTPLRWDPMTPPGGTPIEQARARNNSWYLVVPPGDAFEARYANQTANALTGPSL